MYQPPAAPFTELAGAARWTALFALEAVVIALVLLRFHVAPLGPGLAALAGGLAVSAGALMLAIAAFVVIWRKGMRGFGRALAAFVVSLSLLLPACVVLALALASPSVVDISTDGIEPPPLAFAARDRPAYANPVVYDGANAARQHKAFPQIEPLLFAIPPEDMRRLILKLIAERRWRVVGDVRLIEMAARLGLQDVSPSDRIEAIAISRLYGTVDDISIRIRSQQELTRIDMRSSARFGGVDFGANAERVRSFMADLRNRAELPDQPSQ